MTMATTAMSFDGARDLVGRFKEELARVVVGQRDVVDEMLVALLAGGHALVEGPPGTAKTLLARSLAAMLRVEFRRVQFTPDLMPSDVLGTNVFDPSAKSFALRRGPVFTDVLLADEINRAPAKTQAALLEAMQERQVTIDGERHALSPVFTVFATQNPIEFEGTYPLPEAELDRFLLKIDVGYPEKADELGILTRTRDGQAPDAVTVRAVTDAAQLAQARAAVAAMRAEDAVLDYATEIVRATRSSPLLAVGASPRGTLALFAAARAAALVSGRDFLTPDDVKRMAVPALRHRVILRPEAEIEGTSQDAAVRAIVDSVPVPR